MRKNGLHFQLVNLVESARASFWLIPGTGAVAAFLLEKALVAADRSIGPGREAWFLFGGQADSARELLSTIASSMMTFIGLVFSITILVLQLASNQFSPRVLRTFLQDGVTQAAMAVFVGTFVFSMALLPDTKSGPGEPDVVPALSVFVAFALVLLSVGVFIHYINHMAQSIRAVTIIKKVSAETRDSILAMYPEVARGVDERHAPARTACDVQVVPYEGLAGVVSMADEGALMEVACRSDTVLELVPMPGDFVPRDSPLFRVWGTPRSIDAQRLSEQLHEAVLIADERTPQQDPAFGFRQLVDIAERALSPAVNDPSTAVQALDEIHDLLRTLARREFPSPLRVDAEGTLRLVLPRPDWKAYVHLSLDEIRQYGSNSIQVVRRMRALLQDCLNAAPPERRGPLAEQLQLLDHAIVRNIDPMDRRVAATPSAQGHGQE